MMNPAQRLLFFIIEVIGHATARIVLPIFTFGWVRAVPLSHRMTSDPFLVWREPSGAYVVDWCIATITGIVFWTAALITASRWGLLL